VKQLTIVDEYTRECLAIDVERRFRSDDVRYRLAELFVQRGVPQHIRSDNGPEFAVKAVRHWLAQVGVQTLLITPDSPWKKGYIESFNGRLRDELVDRELFDALWEVKVVVER
jgi:transposase InsO family protein